MDCWSSSRVTNYLPTRFGLSAGGAWACSSSSSTSRFRLGWPASRRAVIWSWVGWTLALGLCDRALSARRAPQASFQLERLWFWFRDNWGVVWALRVLERFNRAAEVSHWPVRLTWFGLVPLSGEAAALPAPSPEELETTFRNLMKRFAESWRLDEVTKQSSSGVERSPPDRATSD